MKRKRVLVIDDNFETGHLIKIVLENEGYTVEVASNGDTGLKKAKDFQPDLVTLDILMPGNKNGIELLDIWEKEVSLKNTPVLVISIMDKELLHRMTKREIEYLPKPIDLEKLLSKVKQAA